MTRRPRSIALALLACGLTGQARGQDAPRRGDDRSTAEFVVSLPPPAPLGEVPDAATLLRTPAVATDLGLTPSQRTRLGRALIARDRRRDLAATPDEPDDQDDDRDLASAIERTLTAAQLGRLAEIGVRRDGVLALARADVADALELDDGRREALAPILEGAFDDLVEAAETRLSLRDPTSRPGVTPGLGPGDLAEFQGRLARARAARARILEDTARQADLVLGPRRREAFARLIGRPFDASAFRPAPPVDAVAAGPPPDGR